MKPQELAALLNISGTTLRHWAREEYREFLSPNAQGGNNSKRSYDERDSRILAWIAQMRNDNIAPASIVDTLRTAQADDWRDLPLLPAGKADDDHIAVVPREAVEERIRALEERFKLEKSVWETERNQLQEHLARSETEKDELRRRLDLVTDQLMRLNDRLTTLLEKERRRK